MQNSESGWQFVNLERSSPYSKGIPLQFHWHSWVIFGWNSSSYISLLKLKNLFHRFHCMSWPHECNFFIKIKVWEISEVVLFPFASILYIFLCYFDSPLCSCMCVFISFHRRGLSWLKQNNRCNSRDQTSDVVLRKLLCVKNLRRHVIDNHSRDLQASNCARVSIKPGGATRSKRQLLELSKNQR